MVKFKSALSLILAVLMLLSLSACGEKKDEAKDAMTEGSMDNGYSAESADVSADSDSADASADSDSDEPSTDESEEVMNDYTPLNYDYMKGVWLYQYSSESLFRKDGKQRDEEEYRKLVTQICANLQRDGFNTLFLQVRGHGDSFYPSELYPPTRYAVEDYDTEFAYDPLEIFCDIAHEYEISLHAWLNPYRLLLAGQLAEVPDRYLIKQWFNDKNGDYIICLDGRYYANPAYPEVQQLVIDGAVEICKNYKVDGIHIDDYFYPSGVTDGFDRIAYSELGNGRSLKQFRYDSVNNLVKGMFDAIHAVNRDLLFGISPAGNMSNNRGYLSADIDTWCTKPGYIDYIAPQVYWSFDYIKDFAKFDICSTDWGNLVTCEDVTLVLGIGLYRTVSPEYSQTDPGWFLYKDNIKRILEFTYDFEKADGFIMFDYESLYDIYTGEYITETAEERENFLPLMKN